MSDQPERPLETCCLCDAHTGRSGRGEDSIYIEDLGPLCVDCNHQIEPICAAIAQQARGAAEDAAKLRAIEESLLVVTEVTADLFTREDMVAVVLDTMATMADSVVTMETLQASAESDVAAFEERRRGPHPG